MVTLEFDSLNPQITKEYLFSKGINQETIISYYTGLNINSKKLFKSILRVDNHVTCSLYKSKSGILYIHDFATNEQINCFELVMRLFNLNYYQALEKIAEDFGLLDNNKVYTKIEIIPEIKETKTTKIQCQIKEFSSSELKWWNSYGVTSKILKKYHVFSIKHVFLNGELRFTSSELCPIFGYYFGKDKDNNELWKIYFPSNKDKGIRFINNLPTKKLQGYKQLNKEGNLLIITKSQKDCMALRTFGFDAIAPSSESTFCSEKQIEEFKKRFKHIVVIYDQDRAGKANMAKIRHKYPELNYFVIPKKYNSKDFSDLIKNYGVEKVQNFVNQFMSNYKFK